MKKPYIEMTDEEKAEVHEEFSKLSMREAILALIAGNLLMAHMCATDEKYRETIDSTMAGNAPSDEDVEFLGNTTGKEVIKLLASAGREYAIHGVQNPCAAHIAVAASNLEIHSISRSQDSDGHAGRN